MENINLIRNVAKTFSEKTDHLSFDELFSQASLLYCEAMEKFDPDNGAKFTTFAWWNMKNELINFCKKETKIANRNNLYDEFPSYLHPSDTMDEDFDFWEEAEDWPEEAVEIAAMVLSEPERFLGETPNYSREDSTPKKRIKTELRKRGWTHKRVAYGMRKMNKVANRL